MHEKLLQFIWQYSLYRPVGLCTSEGEPVTVVFPGRLNTDAGPDFLAARIRIGTTLLVGNVELHVHTKDWLRHGHQHDPAYRNIILHVVYKDDARGKDPSSPLLELGGHIPEAVIRQYTGLLQARQRIPCTSELHRVKLMTRESWLNRLLAERWEQKLTDWQALLEQARGDWRNLLYWRMAANFGFKTNEMPFLLLAQSLPLNLLAKYREDPLRIEALLFGQAGMLGEDYGEEYPRQLQQEYVYLRHKHRLEPIPLHLWKFLRMRPANFPSLRIAQFAALVCRSLHLLTRILERTTVSELAALLHVTAGAYWDTHVRFGEVQQVAKTKRLGDASVRNIIINTIAPIRFLYAHHHGMREQQVQALHLLEAMQPEQNNIVAVWREAGWEPLNAAQSQAMLQLFNGYCSPRRCLECGIGLNILRSGSGSVS